ncbi:phosphate-starvation-inducible PsiE family protein [Thiohalorhabdus methylotrophus]|uniref:Phosphate-starvation-inducible PsiE family protein n=1 Tax=Thiohalorhabdus methylotrophus TaxID=3242694 RepID=A0ABV4TXM0_9GAMM
MEQAPRERYLMALYERFEQVVALVLVGIIALERKHSILRCAVREASLIQVKTVLVFGILALARKLIILDLESSSAIQVMALSVAVVAPGGVYWLMRERDERKERQSAASRPEERPGHLQRAWRPTRPIALCARRL